MALPGTVPLIVAVDNDFPAQTLQALIAHAKANPDKISYAAARASQRVATGTFAGMAGLKMTYVPYKSSPNAVTDLMTAQLQLFTAELAVTLPPVKPGKIQGLAVTSAKRTPLAAERLMVAESGVPGFALLAWFGAWAPAGTPKEAIATLDAAINQAAESKELRERMDAPGVELQPQSPEALGRFAQAETPRWARAIRESGIESE